MTHRCPAMLVVTFLCSIALLRVHGGGSGLNTIVVVNQNSTNSLALGNYYAELRQVPPQNVLRINWSGGNARWTLQEFDAVLRNPLSQFLSSKGLTNQIDYVVLSMEIPYQIIDGQNINSTTSALYYGWKTNVPPPEEGLPWSCSLPPASSNTWAGSESPFRSTLPGEPSHGRLLTTMMTGSNLPLAKVTVYQGTISDGSFPQAPAYFAKSLDAARNVRYLTFDRARFDAQVLGQPELILTNTLSPRWAGPFLGLQTGTYSYSPYNLVFVPGAMVDNLTSYGGLIFQGNAGHLNILTLLEAGATGTYGTLDEPCSWLEKFPTMQNYFYQGRGFTLAESYYQSLTNPYQGVLLGEPLAAPFARASAVQWSNSTGASLTGTVALAVHIAAAGEHQPISRVDLYTNGAWMRTLTNIPPGQGNRLSVTLGGDTINYTVASGAKITTVAAGLAAAINNATSATKVKAVAVGDRVELRLVDRLLTPSTINVQAQSTKVGGNPLSTHVKAARSNFLPTTAQGIRQYVVSGPPADRWVSVTITKTNGAVVTVSATNTPALGMAEFMQQFADKVNLHPALADADGVVMEDIAVGGNRADFNLRPRSAGWDAAVIQADLNAHAALFISPSAVLTLTENLAELQPRNHLYVSAGVTNLPLSFTINSAELGDGFHDLTVVAIEGTSVQTQGRATLPIRVQNAGLGLTLGHLAGTTNLPITRNLRFSVNASDPNVNRIELFSTGGSLGVSSGSSTASFDVPAASLGMGLHPFHATAQTGAGQNVRSATLWLRVVPEVGDVTMLKCRDCGSGHTLSWQAVPGSTYSVHGADHVTGPYEVIAQVSARSNMVTWTDPQAAPGQRFYRVSTP